MTTIIEDLICKICKNIIGARGNCHREWLESVGVCPDCEFWLEKWRMRDSPKVARIGGQHYIYGDEVTGYNIKATESLVDIAKNALKKRSGLGMGGSIFIIRFKDTGRVVITNDLWHQGTIPERFKDALPDNAEMEPIS